MGPDRERRLAVGLVTIQAGLLLAFFALPHRRDWLLPAWLEAAGSLITLVGGGVLVVAALNLGRSLTPLPTPTTSGTLRTGGLYRFVRHPIYSGLLALVFGGAVTAGSAVRLALAVALLALLTGKAAWEEVMLRRRYPDYDEYARRTPRFLPRLVRRHRSD